MPQKGPPSLWSQLKSLDAFPKVNEDFFQKTYSGGVITIVASVFILLLFLSELRLYLSTHTTHELSVDTSRGETITISVDVTFPHMPCAWISIDAMDISGEMHLDVDHDIYKQRLNKAGQPISHAEKHDVASTKGDHPDEIKIQMTNATSACGSCYGAEDALTACCNTCDDVRQAYQRKGWVLQKLSEVDQCKHDVYLDGVKEQEGEGCHVWGKLEVNKVAGNFHFAAGRSFQQGSMHIHDMAPFFDKKLDFSHTIKRISFGQDYPGMQNPLDGVKGVAPYQPGRDVNASGMFQYFLKVVPTAFTDVRNVSISTNQYSVTEHYRDTSITTAASGRTLPGVFFFYDLSPIKVQILEQRSSFLHFLTNVCAIVGGLFAVSGLIDGAIHHGEKLLKKKLEIGKLY